MSNDITLALNAVVNECGYQDIAAMFAVVREISPELSDSDINALIGEFLGE